MWLPLLSAAASTITLPWPMRYKHPGLFQTVPLRQRISLPHTYRLVLLSDIVTRKEAMTVNVGRIEIRRKWLLCIDFMFNRHLTTGSMGLNLLPIYFKKYLLLYLLHIIQIISNWSSFVACFSKLRAVTKKFCSLFHSEKSCQKIILCFLFHDKTTINKYISLNWFECTGLRSP